MKTKIRKSQKTEKKLKRRTHCPACGSTDLINEPSDQICCDCDWNTFYEFVEAGLMDNVPLAAVQHFSGADMFKSTEEEGTPKVKSDSEFTEFHESNKNLNLEQIA